MSSERVSSLQNWEEKNCNENYNERARWANSNRNVIRRENESVNSDKCEGLLCLDRKIDIYMNISQNEIDLLFILSTKIYYWINHLSSSNYPVISAPCNRRSTDRSSNTRNPTISLQTFVKLSLQKGNPLKIVNRGIDRALSHSWILSGRFLTDPRLKRNWIKIQVFSNF